MNLSLFDEILTNDIYTGNKYQKYIYNFITWGYALPFEGENDRAVSGANP